MIGGKRRRVEWALFVACWLGACDGSDTADTGNVCADSACQPAVETTWSCLDSAPKPALGMIRRSLTFVDVLSQMPLAGLDLSYCAKLDPSCSVAVTTGQSNSAGQFEIETPAGYDGYFQVTGAGIHPSLVFLSGKGEQRQSLFIALVPEEFYPTLVQSVGAAMAEDRSLVFATALDCLGRPGAGLALTSSAADSQTVGFVLAGGLPSRTSPITDETGQGGFLNLPAGLVPIQATLAAGNRPVGSREVLVRPGYVTMVYLTPEGR